MERIPPFISFQWRATAARQVLDTPGPLTERDIAMPQPPQPGRPSCDELDIWEANSLANVYTTHPCLNDQCDPYTAVVSTLTLAGTNIFMVVDRVTRWTAPKGSLSSPDSSPSTERTTATSRRFNASISRKTALSNSRHSTVLMACRTPIAAPFDNNETHHIQEKQR